MKNIIARIKASDPAQRRSAGNIFKFLAVLLAFTLIARGTSGATLARVVLATPERSEIVNAISGSATVYATDIIEIAAPTGLTIAEMLVNIGQNIARGDAIALFEMDELEAQRIREEANLAKMHLDLERLERGESIDASSLETAQRNVQRAREDYDATVRQGEADVAEAKEALDALIASTYGTDATMLPSAIRSHQRALEDYYSTLAQGQADIAAAEDALREINVDDTTLQNAIRSHQRALDDYNATLAQGQVDIAEAQEALDELQARSPSATDRTAIETAQRNLQRARDDYNTTRRQGEDSVHNAQLALMSAMNAYYDAVFASSIDQNTAAVSAAWAGVEQAQTAITNAENAAEANLLAARRRVEDAEASLAQAQRTFNVATADDLERAENALEAAETRAADNQLTAARRLEDAETSLEQAHRNFDNSVASATEHAEIALETAQVRAADNQLSAARRLEDAAGSVNSAVEQAQAAVQTAINRAYDNRQTAARRIEDAIASQDTAQQNHERSTQQAADTSAQNVINATTLELDITAQQSTVSTLVTLIANSGILYAEYAGAVSFAMQAGDTTSSAPFVTLRDTTEGSFEAHMHISRTEAERLTVGSESQVTTGGGNMFFTPTVTGVVSSISQPDDNDRVTITIALPDSNWSAGQRVDAQIILSRANYDFSVPISAVHSDNSGYFLLVMEQRNTVMGLQNIVVRANVTVVASDNEMVSVMGPVDRNSQVITGSNKAISVGDRIRVA